MILSAIVFTAIVFTAIIAGYWYVVWRPYNVRLRECQRAYIRSVHPHMTDKEVDEMRKILF